MVILTFVFLEGRVALQALKSLGFEGAVVRAYEVLFVDGFTTQGISPQKTYTMLKSFLILGPL